ncbi:MAG: trigger factor [Bacteroidales bacterium]|jgi:trigger factor|nr:trigger factor [Bacteroidales bacterium]
MEVVKNQIDELNATITVNVANSDIAENVEKTIKEYRRKANVPGFRPGNVPVGLIKKMYGNAIIADELNKLVSKSLTDYITENNLKVLGDPLPSESQEQIEWGKQDNYSFIFDVAVSPEFEVKLSKKDKITKYIIKVDEEMQNRYVNSYKQRFGQFEEAKKSTAESLLTVGLIELNENGEVKENGISIEEGSISVKAIKDEKIKKSFTGIKPGTVVDTDLKTAFPNDTELASLLKITKEEVESMSNLFRVTVSVVKEYKEAEMNQDFFDKCFGEGVVKSEEEFLNRIKEDIGASFVRETKFKLMLDIKDKLIKKADFALPEAFLGRWLRATNKDLTEEQINNEFDRFIEDLKWTLIKSKIAKDNEIKITEDDLVNAAKQQLIGQFAQYGMSYIPDEYLTKYANEMLQKEGEANKLYEQEIEEKVVDFVAEAVKIDEKEVSMEEFNELFK